MPPIPRSLLAKATTAHLRAISVRMSVRTFAAVATEVPASPIAYRGPPVEKVVSKTSLIKYAGKGKAITPGVRHTIQAHHPHLHSDGPLRDLTVARRRNGGRNDTGKVVNRFIGGGHRQRIRIVDFQRTIEGEHTVVRIEYDPGRTAHIALVRKVGASAGTADEGAEMAERVLPPTPPKAAGTPFEPTSIAQRSASLTSKKELAKVRGGWSYILAPDGLRAGDIVRSFRSGIPAGLVPGYSGSHSTPESRENTHHTLSTDPAAPQTVLPPSPTAGSDSASARALGLLRTLTLKPGNVLPLHLCPPGTTIHNISLSPTGKMQLCRSAGTFGMIVAHHISKSASSSANKELAERARESSDVALEKVTEAGTVGESVEEVNGGRGWALVKLQSGEVRKLHPDCVATVGSVSNREHSQEQIGKAGRSRWLGIKPRVRGVAMNACDHPHGGGRGKSKGNKDPRSVWGWLTKKRTRRPKDRDGNKMVVTERPRGVVRLRG